MTAIAISSAFPSMVKVRNAKDLSPRPQLDGRSPDAFKDFEHWLLDQFHEKFGEKPLLNKISGREGTIDHAFSGNCSAPLDNRGKKFLWQIRPSIKIPWFRPVADD